ncbi:MAG: cyclic nucleotide-binding domain-containing protein, partial [Chloroflexota bacterium]
VVVRGREVNRVGAGDGVGEIALLRDVPRTATVTALEDVVAYEIGRAPFLEAVTGHSQTSALADRVVAERLAAHR